MSALSFPSSADAPGDVLSGLQHDHKITLASIGIIEQRLEDPDFYRRNVSLVSGILEQLIDSPDDFHHMTERRLYRRLWYRLGVFLPRYIDLDDLHNERRNRRIEVSRFVGEGAVQRLAQPRARKALASFCACVRAQIATEERRLFPLLERYLSAEDWLLVEDEVKAYHTALSSIRGVGGRTAITP